MRQSLICRKIKRVYLDELKEVWKGLRKTCELAKTISPDDNEFKYLHAAQLIKHILGLKHRSDRGRKRPHLLYLWYDVPGEEGVRHQCEIERFRKVVDADGVWFRAICYQDVIRRLATKYREEPHQAYVDYLAERYL